MKRERDAFKSSTATAATTAVPEKNTNDVSQSPVPGSTIQLQQDQLPPSTPFGVYFPTFFTSPFLIDTTTSGATVGDAGQSPVPTSGTPFFSSTWKDVTPPVNVDGTLVDTASQKRFKELESDNQTLREKLNKAASNNEELMELLKKERETSKALRTQIESTAAAAAAAGKEVTAATPPASFLPSMNSFMPFLSNNTVVSTPTTNTESRDAPIINNNLETVPVNPSTQLQGPKADQNLDKELKSMLGQVQSNHQSDIATNGASILIVPLSMNASTAPAVSSSMPSLEQTASPPSVKMPSEPLPSSSLLGVPMGFDMGVQDYNPLPMWPFSPGKPPPPEGIESNDVAIAPCKYSVGITSRLLFNTF